MHYLNIDLIYIIQILSNINISKNYNKKRGLGIDIVNLFLKK